MGAVPVRIAAVVGFLVLAAGGEVMDADQLGVAACARCACAQTVIAPARIADLVTGTGRGERQVRGIDAGIDDADDPVFATIATTGRRRVPDRVGMDPGRTRIGHRTAHELRLDRGNARNPAQRIRLLRGQLQRHAVVDHVIDEERIERPTDAGGEVIKALLTQIAQRHAIGAGRRIVHVQPGLARHHRAGGLEPTQLRMRGVIATTKARQRRFAEFDQPDRANGCLGRAGFRSRGARRPHTQTERQKEPGNVLAHFDFSCRTRALRTIRSDND